MKLRAIKTKKMYLNFIYDNFVPTLNYIIFNAKQML